MDAERRAVVASVAPDAPEAAVTMTWQAAEAAFASADFQQAMQLYARIPDHEDSRAKYLACAYTLGKRAVNDMEYRRALELLALLPEDYEDAAELTARAHYALAQEAMEAENWEEAIGHLSQISGYKDADKLLAKAEEARQAAYTVQDEE